MMEESAYDGQDFLAVSFVFGFAETLYGQEFLFCSRSGIGYAQKSLLVEHHKGGNTVSLTLLPSPIDQSLDQFRVAGSG